MSRWKTALFSFVGITSVMLAGGLLYLESGYFADFIKHLISERSPQKLGVIGDFTNLKLYFFPPGVGIENPRIRIQKENVTQLPLDAEIEAKELRVNFAPIQMFSGSLQIAEIQLSGGALQGVLHANLIPGKSKPKNSSSPLTWQDLFRLQIDGVRLQDTYLNLKTILPGEGKSELETELVVKDLKLHKARIQGRNGFISSATVNAVRVDPPKNVKLPVKEAHQLQWNLEVSDRGISLNPFSLDVSGIRANFNGEIKGNVLNSEEDPLFEANVDASSNLGTFFSANLNNEDINGEAQVKAKVRGNLKHVAETLNGQFSVQGTQLSWKAVTASHLSVEGDVDLGDQLVRIEKAEISDRFQGDETGKVVIGETLIPLKFKDQIKTQVTLKKADIHWLGGIVLKGVYPLEAKVSGKIQAEFTPGSQWSLIAQNDLMVENFGLTNQRLGKPRPKNYILKPALPIKVQSDLQVNSNGVDFGLTTVQLAQTQLNVKGGVHAQTGLDLHAQGPVSLKEIKEIAENEITGDGFLSMDVRGSGDNVVLDFDPDIRGASYLGYQFGTLKGRITYDDGLAELRFRNIQANQANTIYSMPDGFIDIGGDYDIHMPITIRSGHVDEVAEILTPLVKKISWFPYSLRGELHGKVDIGGKISGDQIRVNAQVEGSDWAWLGEKARRMKFDFDYHRGLFSAQRVRVTKLNGSILGDIHFNSNTDEMKWDFQSENFSLADFDFVDRLEIPVKSKLEMRSSGSGPLKRLTSSSDGRLFDTEIKGESLEPSTASLDIGESTLRLSANLFGSKMISNLKYALTPKQPSSFRLDLNDFDFSTAVLIVNPKLLDDPSLQGRVTSHVQLDFLSTQSELARGEIEVSQYILAKNNFTLKLIDPINVPIQLGYFQFPPTRLDFNHSEIQLQGEGKRGDVDFRLGGRFDLSVVEFLTPAIQKVEGLADADVRIYGPLKNLKVSGDIHFSEANVRMNWLQSPFEDVEGVIRLRQGDIIVDSIDAFLGDEVFSMNGKIQTFTDRFPELDLRAQFENNKVKMAPFDVIEPKGTLFIRGKEPPYLISGNLDVTQALWAKSFGAGSGNSTRGDRFLPKDQDEQYSGGLFSLDLNITANQGFIVRNEILDAEFKGSAHMIGSPEDPKLVGQGQLVQGKLLFKDRPFNLESAKVEFDNPNQLNPKFSASALTEVSPYKIRLIAFGRADAWKAEFSSTPFLPENEIFGVLASGYVSSADKTNRYQNRDRSYVNQGEAASLILHSMDFSKDVQRRTGLQFDVQEAIDSQSATSVFQPQNLSSNIAAPKLVLKRSVGRNVFLSVGSTVGVGNANQREVNAEYKLTPTMSVLGVWNSIEAVNNVTRDSRTSFGLDLRFSKGFK